MSAAVDLSGVRHAHIGSMAADSATACLIAARARPRPKQISRVQTGRRHRIPGQAERKKLAWTAGGALAATRVVVLAHWASDVVVGLGAGVLI